MSPNRIRNQNQKKKKNQVNYRSKRFMVTLIIFPDFFALLSFVAWGDKLSYVFLIYLIFWNIKTLEFVVNEMKIWPGANNCWKIIKTEAQPEAEEAAAAVPENNNNNKKIVGRVSRVGTQNLIGNNAIWDKALGFMSHFSEVNACLLACLLWGRLPWVMRQLGTGHLPRAHYIATKKRKKKKNKPNMNIKQIIA